NDRRRVIVQLAQERIEKRAVAWTRRIDGVIPAFVRRAAKMHGHVRVAARRVRVENRLALLVSVRGDRSREDRAVEQTARRSARIALAANVRDRILAHSLQGRYG